MLAVILAGGKGTRLKPFTMTIPKPLLPLGDIPIVEVVVRQLASSGITDVHLTLGHMVHLFTAFLDSAPQWGVDIRYSIEETPLGTAGPLKLLPKVEDDFLVMNGDLLTSIDYGELLKTHRERNAWATIAVHKREVNIDYGVIEIDERGELHNYTEKPTFRYNVSMGINILSKQCLDLIPTGHKFDMPDLLMAIREAGKPVACYETECYWQDIGRFEDYQHASKDFVQNPGRFLSDLGEHDENSVDHRGQRVLRTATRETAA